MPQQATGKTYEAFSQLPNWAKGVIGVVVTGTVAFALYKGYEAFQQWQTEKKAKAVAGEADDTFKALQKKGQTLSFPESNYSATASLIENLLSGAETPASEFKVVEEIAKVVKKPIDWFYLVKVFGSRDIDDIGFSKTNYNLITLLKEQLGATIAGHTVLGERYWTDNTLSPLTKYLGKMGVSI